MLWIIAAIIAVIGLTPTAASAAVRFPIALGMLACGMERKRAGRILTWRLGR